MNQSERTYRRFASFYDVYTAGFSADLPLYLSLCSPRDRILEVGCGTGRVLQAFLDRGYAISGLDSSAEMLRIARRKLEPHLRAGRLRLHCGTPASAEIDGEYGRVLVTWYTFNYLLEDAERVEFLRSLARRMGPGGLLVLDLFHPAPLLHPETEDHWQETSHVVNERRVQLRQKRKMIGDVEERTQVYVEGDSSEEIVTRRRFATKQQISTLLLEAGFGDVLCTDGYESSSLHPLAADEGTDGHFAVTAQRSPRRPRGS